MKVIGAFTFCNESHLIIPQIENMLFLCDEVVALSDNPAHDSFNIASSFIQENKFHLFFNNKKDSFHERDETGDRQRLFDFAKSRGADVYYYTDVDELISLSTTNKAKEVINSIKEDEILLFPRYDFWGNAHNYRLLRNGKTNNQEIKDIVSPHTTKYVCHTKYATSFDKMAVPNFHAKRLPKFSIKMKEITIEEIKVFHYGYFNQRIINEKKQFYLRNSKISNVEWGKDMSATTEEYKELYGVGVLGER